MAHPHLAEITWWSHAHNVKANCETAGESRQVENKYTVSRHWKQLQNFPSAKCLYAFSVCSVCVFTHINDAVWKYFLNLFYSFEIYSTLGICFSHRTYIFQFVCGCDDHWNTSMQPSVSVSATPACRPSGISHLLFLVILMGKFF